MGLVPAKCTSCCGTLEVDAELKAAICPHCGSAYIVQEAINQYNITNVYQINKASLKIDHRQLFADRIEAAEKQLRLLKDYPKALSSFIALQNDVPEEFRVWSGMLEARSKGYDEVAVSNIYLYDRQYLSQLSKDYDNAYTTADDEQKKEINDKYLGLLKRCFDKIKAAEELLTQNAKLREKARTGENGFGKVGAVFFILLLLLGLLALLVCGFLFLTFFIGETDGEYIMQSALVGGLSFLPAIVVLVVVIIFESIAKKYEKKFKKISEDTTRVLETELHLNIPNYNELGEYYSLCMECRNKLSFLSGEIKKYTINK